MDDELKRTFLVMVDPPSKERGFDGSIQLSLSGLHLTSGDSIKKMQLRSIHLFLM